VHVWNPTAREALGTLENTRPYVTCVAHSPDGQLVATGGWDKVRSARPALSSIASWSPPRRHPACVQVVRLWSAQTRKRVAVFDGPERAVTCVAWSLDASMLVRHTHTDTPRLLRRST
jgi:WD40 repeat protein